MLSLDETGKDYDDLWKESISIPHRNAEGPAFERRAFRKGTVLL
jgi:hypothetical protein